MGEEETAARFRGSPQTRALGHVVPVASTRRVRLLGLAGLRLEAAGPGLLIPHCAAVHTFGMRFALDLYFLGSEGEPLEVRRAVPGWRFARCRGAVAVLEVPVCGFAAAAAGGESASRRA